jgi:hypothetical protein
MVIGVNYQGHDTVKEEREREREREREEEKERKKEREFSLIVR